MERMEKIKDERLVLKNLQNIKTAYIIQTLGIIGILAYDAITKGLDRMTDNPIWYVFTITSIVTAYLSMNISIDHEKSSTSPKKGLFLSFAVLAAICFTLGLLTYLTGTGEWMSSVLVGLVCFVCGAVPIVYVYYLRVKKKQDNE